MCQEPTELQLIGYLIGLTWVQELKNNYGDTKNQLAEILTKESFIRDRWNHLLHVLNIMDLSMCSCSRSFHIESKANSTECHVEKKARSIFRGK